MLRSLVHGAVTVVVEPLGQRGKLAGAARFAKTVGQHLDKGRATLSALLGEVVLCPAQSYRPQVIGTKHAAHALVRRDVRQAALGV